MAKRTKRKNKSQEQSTIITNNKFDANDLKQTIVEALLEYEKIEKKRELDQKREKKQARQNLLGLKDYSQSNSRFKWLL
ncbi:MAG: hypothetical protein K2K10_01145, partial [Acetatifactor sp.]|nr:hypothetical protein [Acetatifactor sp.]